MLEVKDFVKTILTEISAGVNEASKQVEAENSGTKINVVSNKRSSFCYNITEVNFDLAVTSIETDAIKSDGKAGASIKVLSAGVNQEKSTSFQNSNVSRITFSVVLGFPAHSEWSPTEPTSLPHRKHYDQTIS